MKKKKKHTVRNNISGYSSSSYNNTTSRKSSSNILKTVQILLVIIGIVSLIVIIVLITKGFYDNNYNEYTVSSNVIKDDEKENEKLLVMVNSDTALKPDYNLDLTDFYGVKIDKILVDDLNNMLDKAKQNELDLKVIRGYVSKDEQQNLHDNLVDEYSSQGFSKTKAETEASKVEPAGNHSEMQTGLCVDIASEDISNPNDFVNTKEYRWLVDNCVYYGFVQRYPEDKVEDTKSEFKPSRFRYVGVENAKKMRILNLCFEKYKEYISCQTE